MRNVREKEDHMTNYSEKYYHFNLGLSDEEVSAIPAGYHAVSTYGAEVYKKNNAIYADFEAMTENQIEKMLDDACFVLKQDFPMLTLAGTSFEEDQTA